MKIDILTLFPDAFSALNTSIIGKAREKGILDINLINFRDFADNDYKSVDDYCFGGGQGMLIQPQPLFDCIQQYRDEQTHVVYLSPSGKVFNSQIAKRLAEQHHLMLICGHYEGIDERVLEEIVTDYVSIGDYVLTGGELPAMVMIDAISRFIPGVLNNDISAETESFTDNLLEYPQYTRPAVFRGMEVPEVLLNGNHALIAKWRREKSIETTYRVRPELIDESTLDKKEKLFLQGLKNQQNNQ